MFRRVVLAECTVGHSAAFVDAVSSAKVLGKTRSVAACCVNSSRTIRSSSSARSSKDVTKKADETHQPTSSETVAGAKSAEAASTDISVQSSRSGSEDAEADGVKRDGQPALDGKAPREDAVKQALKAAQATASFHNNMIPGASEQTEKGATSGKKIRKAQPDIKLDEKASPKWQTTVKRGVPSFADLIPLKELVDARIPILENLDRRLGPVDVSTVPLLGKNFPYPYHTATTDSLRSTITALTNPDLLQYITRVPLMSSGLILLASPFEGSEIYLRKIVESIVAGLSQNASEDGKQTSPVLFASISNHDLFSRLSGFDVVSAPPIKPGSIDYSEGSFLQPRAGGNGRRPKQSGTPIGSFGLVVELQRPTSSQSKSGEEDGMVEDIPQIPY
ncbi:hypothetical protein HDU67_001053, partial [Dinochytrium kinnereticum]